MKKISILCWVLIFVFAVQLQAKIKPIERIEPAFWWTGMVNNELQIMVYGDQIATAQVSIESDKATVKSFETTTNENYLFINLEINPNAKPGNFDIVFKQGKKSFTESYTLKARRQC